MYCDFGRSCRGKQFLNKAMYRASIYTNTMFKICTHCVGGGAGIFLSSHQRATVNIYTKRLMYGTTFELTFKIFRLLRLLQPVGAGAGLTWLDWSHF